MTSRHHLAAALRVLASLALLVISLTLWNEPLGKILQPRVAPVAERLGISTLLDRPGSGFMLQINSTPTDATFAVQGETRGNTPAMANVLCRHGETVVITVKKKGFAEYKRQVECREGGRLQVRARLER
jgi:hypothetical protein